MRYKRCSVCTSSRWVQQGSLPFSAVLHAPAIRAQLSKNLSRILASASFVTTFPRSSLRCSHGCTRFRFAPLSRPAMESRLRYVIEKEGFVDRVQDGQFVLSLLFGGDMRKVLRRCSRYATIVTALPSCGRSVDHLFASSCRLRLRYSGGRDHLLCDWQSRTS